MTREKLRIGLFGYGCVGQGLHDVLNSSRGFRADIVRICVKDRNKKRRIPMSNFTFDKNDILNDRRKILYTTITKANRNAVLSLLNKKGIQYENHVKDYYFIYI